MIHLQGSVVPGTHSDGLQNIHRCSLEKFFLKIHIQVLMIVLSLEFDHSEAGGSS